MALFVGSLLLLSACLFGTDERVAGGGSETEYFSLTGTATMPNGVAAAACQIRIRPTQFLYDPEFPLGMDERDLVTDSQGVFSVKRLPAGEYRVEAAMGDSLGFTALATVIDTAMVKDSVARKGTRVDGILQRTGSLTVRITDRNPDLDYYIQAYGLKRRALADTAGIATVLLAPGDYRVRVMANSKDISPTVYSKVKIRSGADTSLPAVFLPPVLGSKAIPIIFDCNIGFAVDDAASLSLLHAMADSGEARILAMGTTNPTFFSAAMLDVINTHHGRGTIAVGTWKGENPSLGSGYDVQLAGEFPHDMPGWDSVPDAATVYRKAMEGQPDGSIVLLLTGDVRNAWALLRASKEIVARKVKLLVMVGGRHPSGREFNFSAGIARDTLPNMTREVVENWPTPIHFVGAETGEDMVTGSCLANASMGGPLKRIYDLRLRAPNPISPSTDLVGVLYAVRGLQSYWTLVSEGGNLVSEDGSNVWNLTPDTQQSYLLRMGGPQGAEAALDSVLCAIPNP
jgi:hypothetical protein